MMYSSIVTAVLVSSAPVAFAEQSKMSAASVHSHAHVEPTNLKANAKLDGKIDDYTDRIRQMKAEDPRAVTPQEECDEHLQSSCKPEEGEKCTLVRLLGEQAEKVQLVRFFGEQAEKYSEEKKCVVSDKFAAVYHELYFQCKYTPTSSCKIFENPDFADLGNFCTEKNIDGTQQCTVDVGKVHISENGRLSITSSNVEEDIDVKKPSSMLSAASALMLKARLRSALK